MFNICKWPDVVSYQDQSQLHQIVKQYHMPIIFEKDIVKLRPTLGTRIHVFRNGV